MAAIERLNIVNPAANTNTAAFTSDGAFFVSVIATNKSATANALISVWVAPGGTDTAGGRGYIASNLPLPVSNTYETIRFAANSTDVVRVEASTADVSFTVVGIDQPTI
jgi:hypothetical protein